MAVIDWIREKLPALKGQPIIISWTWRCDPELWVVEKIRKVIEKVKK